MRTETTTRKIYEFGELNEEAKQVAIAGHRQSSWDCQMFIACTGKDMINSLKAFCDHFDIEILDYSLGAYSHSYCTAKHRYDDDIGEMKGVRVWKYLVNNDYLNEGLLAGECPFTGLCFDESLLDGIREFMQKPISDWTIQDLIDDCLNRFTTSYIEAEEYEDSDASIIELIEINEYEFTDGGELI